MPITDRAPPIWLRVIPEEPGFFHGVGFTSQSNDPAADQKQAALRAREAMVGEITSSLKRSLSGNGIEPGMWERLSWEGVLTDLEQLTPADVYLEQHKHRVWAYVKVGRADLQQLLERRKGQLEGRARKHVAQAETFWQAGQLVEALREQLAALHRLAGPEGLMISSGGTLLRVEVERGLSRMLDRLTLSRVAGPDGGHPSQLRDVPLVLKATRKDDNTPLVKLPVAFRFTRGAGSVTPTGLTDGSGQVSAQLFSVDPRVSPAEVLASPDLQALLTASKLTPLPDTVLDPLKLPAAAFTFTLNPPRLLLTHIERGGTGGARSSLVINELGEAFRQQGITVSDASVSLLVNPETFQKVETGKPIGPISEADFIGVVSISLERIKPQKGRYQTVFTGEGLALFRLYDVTRSMLIMDIRMNQSVSGFSKGDVERNFFLQSMDELRTKVMDQLAEDPLHMRNR
ncbi:MAG: hypothetical protein ACKO6N_08945 [Myxococcota bacterium]